METLVRVTWNTVTTWLAMVVNAVIGLTLLPLMIYHLGKDGYGLIILSESVVGLIPFLDLGVTSALQRQLAAQVAAKNDRHFDELISSSLCLFILIGGLFSGICIFAVPIITNNFYLSTALSTQATSLFQFYTGISILMSFILSIFISILVSHNRFDLDNNISIGINIAQSICLLLFLSFSHLSYYGWVVIALSSQLLYLIVTAATAFHLHPNMQICFRHVRLDAILEIISIGCYFFFGQLYYIFASNLDPLIITRFLGLKAVTAYRPASILPKLPLFVILSFVDQLTPLTTAYHIRGSIDRLREILFLGTRYIMLIGILVSTILVVFAYDIAKVWLESSMGSEYLAVGQLLMIIAIADLFVYASGTQRAILTGTNRIQIDLWLTFPLSVLNFVASIILVRYTSLGVIGVVIPTLVMEIILRPIFIMYTAQVCKIEIEEYLLKAYLRPGIILIMLSLISVGLRMIINPSSITELIACIVAVTLIWCLLSWCFLPIQERRFIRAGWYKLVSHTLAKV